MTTTEEKAAQITRPRASGRKWAASALGLTLVTLLTVMLRALSVNGEDLPKGNPFTLAGSWLITVGAAPGPVFTALETFTDSGGSVETNNGPGSGPLAPAIGAWVRTGQRTFLATIWRQRFDQNGVFEGSTKVRRLITISETGLEFSGRDNVDLFDSAGNRIPIDIPPAPFHASRIVPEDLDP